MNSEEAVYWHIATASRALAKMKAAMDNRGAETPVAHSHHMFERILLVKEHMEGLEFEYELFWKEHLD